MAKTAVSERLESSKLISRKIWRSKTAFFAILGGCAFCLFGNFQSQESAKIHKNWISEPLNVSKCLILHFKIPQNWFHVKSEWQKNPEISTLCKMIMITMVKIYVWPSYGSSQSVECIDLFNSSFANYWWKITHACDIGWSSSLKFVSKKCVWQHYCNYYRHGQPNWEL